MKVKGAVLRFDNSRFIVLSNWRQPFAKRVSRPENVGGDGSWPDWEIKMAGEFTPSVMTSDSIARFLMRCLLHYQESHSRVNFYLHDGRAFRRRLLQKISSVRARRTFTPSRKAGAGGSAPRQPARRPAPTRSSRREEAHSIFPAGIKAIFHRSSPAVKVTRRFILFFGFSVRAS